MALRSNLGSGPGAHRRAHGPSTFVVLADGPGTRTGGTEECTGGARGVRRIAALVGGFWPPGAGIVSARVDGRSVDRTAVAKDGASKGRLAPARAQGAHGAFARRRPVGLTPPWSLEIPGAIASCARVACTEQRARPERRHAFALELFAGATPRAESLARRACGVLANVDCPRLDGCGGVAGRLRRSARADRRTISGCGELLTRHADARRAERLAGRTHHLRKARVHRTRARVAAENPAHVAELFAGPARGVAIRRRARVHAHRSAAACLATTPDGQHERDDRPRLHAPTVAPHPCSFARRPRRWRALKGARRHRRAEIAVHESTKRRTRGTARIAPRRGAVGRLFAAVRRARGFALATDDTTGFALLACRVVLRLGRHAWINHASGRRLAVIAAASKASRPAQMLSHGADVRIRIGRARVAGSGLRPSSARGEEQGRGDRSKSHDSCGCAAGQRHSRCAAENVGDDT
jgi:hypothetical protein